MKVKYKQYAVDSGAIIVYEDGDVCFIPNLNEEELDFDNEEWGELMAEDEEEFENEEKLL